MPMHPITCLKCRQTSEVLLSAPVADDWIEREVFTCTRCGARMVYGKLAPIKCVEPHTDERGRAFLRIRTQHPISRADLFVEDLDPRYAAHMALEILALVVK